MDRYTKVKQIGEGSFGKALLVRHKENGKQFVVKEINMSRMAKKERDEARKEVAVLAQLNHSNIVTYKESFEEIGNLYIVMDYCDAGDLYGRINTQRGVLFMEDQIIDWFVQTCLAIKHIHDRKILHRDIKSQNIFLTKHGIVKLGDFGIAKVLNSTVELARTCIGTPYYLSPEICENKPYNNKSDIWSLGCVLYELTTLKHAFEAGNMKNLVLKIIRGNFPPPPPRYSYELRSLINQLFKRSPRDRPSINLLLKKPILQARIRKYLSESEVAEEFSHTVMHGVKMKKVLPAGGARPLPPKPVAAKKPPSAPVSKYNPASVYGVPVNRKSRDGVQVKKSVDVRRSGEAKRPGSSGGAYGGRATPYNSDLARKKQELVDKEKKRREEAKKKDDHYAKQHQALIEKQKVARLNRAREQGWKSLMDSLSSDDSNNSPRSDEIKKPAPAPAYKPSNAARPPLQDRPNYDHYHDYLDKLERERKVAGNVAAAPAPVISHRPMPKAAAKENRAEAGDGPGVNAPAAIGGGGGGARYDPVYNAIKGQAAGANGHAASEKARLVEEYMQRRAMAANNKARANGDLYGGAGAKGALNAGRGDAPAPKPSVGAPKPSAAQNRPQSARNSDNSKGSAAAAAAKRGRPQSAREQHEQEYLSRLKQIRLQNFNERRDKVVQKSDDKYKPLKQVDPKDDAESRRKKIEALRAQADERAQRLKKELERKRQEAYDHEKRYLQNMGGAKPKPVKPSPAVPITEVLNAIGARADADVKPARVPITQALNAIGAAPKQPVKSKEPSIGMTAAMSAIGASRDDENRASIQKKKEQILKRLNSKPIETPTDDKPDRPKWGQAVKPALPDRPKWGGEGDLENLENMTLEDTASEMDATSAQDVVLKHPGQSVQVDSKEQPARKGWSGKPSNTVLNLLKAAGLNDTTASNTSATSDSSETSSLTTSQSNVGGSTITISNPSDNKAPVIGSTITISRDSQKGTVVIKKSELPSVQTADQPDSSVQERKKDQQKYEKELVIDEEKEEDETENKDKLENDQPIKSASSPRSNARSSSPKAKVETEDITDQKSPLFNKVDLDEEEKDSSKEGDNLVLQDFDVTEKAKQVEIMPKSGLLMSLRTGNFDIGNVKLLRTCSEPNLSKLFQTDIVENPFYTEEEVAKSVQLAAALLEDLSDDEEDEDIDAAMVRASLQKVMDAENDEDEDDSLEYSLKDIPTLLGDDNEDDIAVDEEEKKVPCREQDENGEEDGEQEDEEDDDEDDDTSERSDEDNDMETLRQSMMDILDNEDAVSDEETMLSSKKKTKKVTKKAKKARKKRRERLEAEAAAAGKDQKCMYAQQWSASSVEDFKSMRETMKSVLQPDAGTKSKLAPVKEAGVGGAIDSATNAVNETVVSLNPNTEAWQSDDDPEPDDDYWEEEDMFSRLEESRMKLEEELGCDTFMKAYKTVQAIHEDEDENIEEGLKLVTNILGAQKSHLYPSILQLVMADGVWTEDND